jgi:GNAT superfamily N-acetyltransferase
MIGVRTARIEDCAAVEAIVQAAYAVYLPRIGRKPAPMLDDYATLIRDQLVHVVEEDGVICGIVVLIPKENMLLIDNIAVAPRAQGGGYGRILMEFAEQCAFTTGCDLITLYTNEAMTENLALYSRVGFVETHGAVEDGLRRVYMAKALRRL